MRFIDRALPILDVANHLFKEGIKVGKAIVHICVIGVIATATLITQLIGIKDEEDEDLASVEPP